MAEVIYEFPVHTRRGAGPGQVVSTATEIARGFFDHHPFDLSITVRGSGGQWEVWATATMVLEVRSEGGD